MKKMRGSDFPFMKVLWAVDPFAALPSAHEPSAKAVRALVASVPAVIEPVYVLRPVDHAVRDGAFLNVEERFRNAAEDSFANLFQEVSLPGVTSPRFLGATGSGLRSAVDALLKYAEESECDLIVLSTHARKGVARLFLGSFAETLLLQSPVPVLIVNPKAHPIQRISHVLFPTDFSPAAHIAFASMLPLVRQLQAKLVFFHQLELPYSLDIFPTPAYPITSDFTEYLRDVEGELRRTGAEWEEVARQEGVEAKLIFSKGRGGPATNIVRAAKKLHSGIVALASHKGPIATAVLGSITRQVVRAADCPVLVMHLAAKELEHRKSA